MPEPVLPLQWIVLGVGAILLIALAVLLYRSRQRPAQEGRAAMSVSQDRIQRAEEAIIGDASLTDEMDDTPAERLLSWGADMARQMANGTAAMDDLQAQEFLEAKLQALRKVIRRINKLIGSLSDATPEEISDTLQRIMEAASEVPALRAQMPEGLNSTAQRLQALPPEDALSQILSYLNQGDVNDQEKTR